MNANLQQLVESRHQEMVQRNKGLVKVWEKYINSVETYLKNKGGQALTEHQKSVIARCLENSLVDCSAKSRKPLFETTYQSDIAFLGVQLPVIAALIPSLALNHLAVVQALDRRQGAVFFMDVLYGTTKGAVTAGDKMIDVLSGHDRTVPGRRYATNRITAEGIGSGTGAATVFTTGTPGGGQAQLATPTYVPLIKGSLSIVIGAGSGSGDTEITITDTEGTLVGDGVASGTVDYNTGAITFTLDAPADNEAPITMSYRFDMGRNTAGVGEVNFNLRQEPLSAEDFKLRSKYEMGAAIDLEKAHGIVFDDEMVKFLGAEIKFEIDHMGIDEIVRAAQGLDGHDSAAAISAWDGAPGANQEWVWKKWEFKNKIAEGNNNILKKTLRAYATYIVTGTMGAQVMTQLEPSFKAENVGSKAPSGPHKIGTLDGRDVILDPLVDDDMYVLGFKGDSPLYGSFLYAPYIPMFSTPTLVTSDLHAQKGFMSAAGFKVLNAGMLTYGTISALP